uniref:GpcrRhopsn4 domain-containing protein n=1 Tax=Panagrellus redivivus TaxID=6233 RepID=A0A7E4VFZ3_PANRE
MVLTYAILILSLILGQPVYGVHRKGVIDTDEHVHILAKFGVRQMDPIYPDRTKGYIYGNITAGGTGNVTVDVTNRAVLLIVPETKVSTVLLDSSYAVSCSSMMREISEIAFEPQCFTSGKRSDLMRWVPCPKNELCAEEDNPDNVLKGYQFTFRLDEPYAPEYWYVLLITCSLTSNCNWTLSNREFPLEYDIWLNNGNPETSFETFSREFSFDEQEIIHIYMIAFIIYITLALFQLRAIAIDKHSRLPFRQRILSWVIGFKCSALLLQSTNTYIYAFVGHNVNLFVFVGELLRIFAVCGFCLLLILLARGYSLNRLPSQAYSNRVHYVWCLFSTIHVVLFLYDYFTDDAIVRPVAFDFLADKLIIVLRILQGLWFIVEIKKSLRRETDEERAVFLIHLGAAYMVWFVYLLGLGFIAIFISPMWRLKIVLSISTFANFVAIAGLVHVFWPTGSSRKFFSRDGNIHRHIERTSSTELDDYERLLIAADSSDNDDIIMSEL